MKVIDRAWACFFVALLLLPASGCDREQPVVETTERPIAEGMNVLLVTLDTTRVDYVSPFGGDPRNTPHLQALADRSVIFTNAVSETNVTSPSHLTIMSGLRMVEHGLMANGAQVPNNVDTLPEAMKRAGYRTGGFPAARHVAVRMGWRDFDKMKNVRRVLPASTVSNRALRWIEESSDAPFFAWAHYFDPHSIYRPPPELAAQFYSGDREAGDGPKIADNADISRKKQAANLIEWLGDTRDLEFPRAMYAAEIHFMDRELGRLLDGLERLGLAENTLVVVVADHGESLDEHGIFYGHQGIYEQQLRIPLIIHVPGLAASTSDALATTLDVTPTISSLTGVRLRHGFSGLSLMPLLQGKESPELAARNSFVHYQARNRALALRQDGWKLIWPTFKSDPLLSDRPQLFHLQEDPGELVDLAEAQPRRFRAMREALKPWIKSGVAKPSDNLNLEDQDVEHLRALGYLAD